MFNTNTILCSKIVGLISYNGVFVVIFKTMLKVLACKNLFFTSMVHKRKHNARKVAHIDNINVQMRRIGNWPITVKKDGGWCLFLCLQHGVLD